MWGDRTRSGWAVTVALAAALAMSLLPPAGGRAAAEPSADNAVLKVIGVGGVLTADGVIWQFRPDRGRWETIDESFRDQGKETHILPLPVPAGSVREMVTFGFLLTDTGDCWLYDLDKDRWQKLPAPRATR